VRGPRLKDCIYQESEIEADRIYLDPGREIQGRNEYLMSRPLNVSLDGQCYGTLLGSGRTKCRVSRLICQQLYAMYSSFYVSAISSYHRKTSLGI
jgi:hypothetical protein